MTVPERQTANENGGLDGGLEDTLVLSIVK